MQTRKKLSSENQKDFIATLETRFHKNMERHERMKWKNVLSKLLKQPDKLWSLHQMEASGGEPDVIGFDQDGENIIFYDCSKESPSGRRSLCYDKDAWESRKQNKPKYNAMDLAADMGIDMLEEQQYRELQELGEFDTKTSSWIKTPGDIREKGGALFCDYRFGHTFVYHNGAESYYAARGFRGLLKI